MKTILLLTILSVPLPDKGYDFGKLIQAGSYASPAACAKAAPEKMAELSRRIDNMVFREAVSEKYDSPDKAPKKSSGWKGSIAYFCAQGTGGMKSFDYRTARETVKPPAMEPAAGLKLEPPLVDKLPGVAEEEKGPFAKEAVVGKKMITGKAPCANPTLLVDATDAKGSSYNGHKLPDNVKVWSCPDADYVEELSVK